MDSILHTATTELLVLPTSVSDIQIDFDADTYRADLKRMSDTDLDAEIVRTVQVGTRSLIGFAMAARANALARYELGTRTEKSPTGGAGGSSLLGGNDEPLTPVARKQRSEGSTVAEWLDEDEVDELLTEGRGFNTLITAARTKKREAETGPPAPLPKGVFDLILADPPWRYEFAESNTREVENHYPTMTLDDICAIDPPAADDSVLYLWATSPKLTEALQVIEAWGFEYKTSMVWVKDKIGMGYHARARHELILIATRGTPGVPEPANRPDSVIEAPRTEHSAKPDRLQELIETAYPDRSYLEMFARRPRDGWAVWGNES